MSKNTLFYSLAAGSILVTGLVSGLLLTTSAQTAQASSSNSSTSYQVNVDGKKDMRKPMMRQEDKALMDAVKNGDWNTFQTELAKLPDSPKKTDLSKITQDNFPKLTQMQKYIEDKNITEADKLATELGLPTSSQMKDGRGGKGMKMHDGNMPNMNTQSTDKAV